MRILLIYSLWDLHLFPKLFWRRVNAQKVSGRERTGRKGDGHNESAGIHFVTMLEIIRIVLMCLLDLSEILMKTLRGWDCFNTYQVQKRSYASTFCFTLVQDSTQGISVILLKEKIQSSPSCTRQVALLHIEMLHNSLGRKGREKNRRRLYLELWEYLGSWNLIANLVTWSTNLKCTYGWYFSIT